jgi:putative transposase
MSRLRFQKGMHIEFCGREYVVEARLPNGNFRIRDIALDEAKAVVEEELVNALFDGQLVFLGDSKTTGVQREFVEKLVDDLNVLDDEDLRKIEAKRRWAYVAAIINSKSPRLNASTLVPLIKRIHAEIQDPNKVPHWRTVFYCWFKSFLASGEDARVLVLKFRQRGNTKRRFAKGRKAKEEKFSEKELRLAEEVAAVVKGVIDEEYLNPQRLSVQEVWDKLDARIAEINQLRDPDDKLPVPHKNSLYYIVSRLDAYDKDRARFGKRYADQKHRCNKQAPQPTRPLERTEIDHTKLDLFVVDEETRMPLGRATLTTLLDKYSREVLGINVGFDPPSYLSVMQCLNHAIKPKNYLKTEFPKVKNEWEAYGLPELIVVDNGKEFHSKDFEDACLQLGIVVMYSPPYVPRYKGAIERFFGTENRRLLHQQHGTTFSNIFERHGYDPRKNAVISFDAFMQMLHIWIVDVYHQSYHRGLKDIPAHIWRVGTKHYPPALPRRIEDLRVLLGHIEHRVIGPSGIELFTLFYNCEELAPIRRQQKVKDKVVVKYDPSDLSLVYVYDRQKDKYIAVPALDQEYTKGLSLWQHRVIQSQAARDAKGRVKEGGLREAKKMIQDIVDAEIAKRGKAGSKSKVARWENTRQPDYSSHPDPSQQSAEAKECDGKAETEVFIDPEVNLYEGISAIEGASSGVAQDEDAQPISGVIDLATEAKKRKGKKSGSKHSGKVSKTAMKESAAANPSYGGNSDTCVDEGEDLDMTGFNVGYNLPGKEANGERQAS